MGHGGGHFSSICHEGAAHVCLHLLGLNLLALQRVCSLNSWADRQRGQTGCYRTPPCEEEKKGLRAASTNQVCHVCKSTLRTCGTSQVVRQPPVLRWLS